jgi:hypothetical protein
MVDRFALPTGSLISAIHHNAAPDEPAPEQGDEWREQPDWETSPRSGGEVAVARAITSMPTPSRTTTAPKTIRIWAVARS